jgi:CTP:molybdopterin cytidylyltransferase MocA
LDGSPAYLVAISRQLYPLVPSLSGAQGIRTLLAQAHRIARIPIRDPGAMFDLDVVEDLHR